MMQRLLILLNLLCWLPIANAHEGRPVFIELQQTATQAFLLRWKIPPVIPEGQAPLIQLKGEGCSANAAPATGLSGSTSYRCSVKPAALTVSLHYPAANPALSTLLMYTPLSGEQQQYFTGPDTEKIVLAGEKHFMQLAQQYLWSGIQHLLAGYDHLLFLLCLMWIARTPRRLVLTVTGFTLGHSITLALASLGIVRVPVAFIEILIALSIVVLAAEIVKQKQTTLAWRYPIAVAVFFGLLHGFGFASVLGDFGLPKDRLVAALLFFNLGIEVGQLLVVAGIWFAYRFIYQFLQQQMPALAVQQATFGTLLLYSIGVLSAYWVLDRSMTLL